MSDNRFLEICKKISYIYNNKVYVELEQLEELFIEFTKMLFMRVFNIDREPIVEVTDGDEYAGCYNGYTTFFVNRNQVKKFQKGMALDLFETICHELNHFTQKRTYKNINIKNSIIEKDSYLKDKIEGYYDSNYDFFMSEIDAFLSQNKDAMDILNALNITPSVEEIEISKQVKARYFENAMVTNRFDGKEIKNINDLFSETLVADSLEMDDFDKKNFLEFRPCTNIEYKIIDNKFIRRTSEEVSEIYSSWQNGDVQFQGIPTEIDMYFKYTIGNLKAIEQEIFVPKGKS